MKRTFPLVFISSLFFGAVLTICLVSQMAWRPTYNCKHQASSANIAGCDSIQYGYPTQFIVSHASVTDKDHVLATTSIDKGNLFINWATWSAVSFLILTLIVPLLEPVKGRRKKTSTAKKKK